MPIVVNTNSAATSASFNLSKANDALRQSLARLSSGNRITQPSEDAGGLAVAYKLDSHAKRTEAVLNNHQNALSDLQLQDGALESVGDIVSRMAELRTMAADVTKNTGDKENYSKEFRELQTQLNQIKSEKFNGIRLFSDDDVSTATDGLEKGTEATGTAYAGGANDSTYDKWSFKLITHPSGVEADGSIDLNVVNLEWLTKLEANVDPDGGGAAAAGAADLSKTEVTAGILDIETVSIEEFTNIIQKVADARAENGAEQQRVTTSYNLHSQNLVNLEAARGRIMDTDVALESTRFARHNVLVQASASMTAQANQLTNVALTLLQ
jgi:flagellin